MRVRMRQMQQVNELGEREKERERARKHVNCSIAWYGIA